MTNEETIRDAILELWYEAEKILESEDENERRYGRDCMKAILDIALELGIRL